VRLRPGLLAMTDADRLSSLCMTWLNKRMSGLLKAYSPMARLLTLITAF